MRRSPICLSALLLSLGVAGAAPVVAANQESASFRLTAVVRTICRLEFGGFGTMQGDGIIDFGSFMQLCNSRDGYRVIMQHPANMSGATLMIDGQAVPLSNGNETIIANESRPAFKISGAQLDISDVDVPVTNLSFRIEPKGVVY